MPLTPLVRSLLRSPLFSTLAILTIALGIGATTALFSVIDAVILQPFAFPAASRIVAIETSTANKQRTTPRMTGGDFLDLRSAATSFSSLAVYAGGEIGIRLHDQARFASTFEVDPAFFDVLHVQPSAGRLARPSDAEHSAVLTATFARSNFGAPENALGQTISVDNKAYQVIGIVADAFAFPEKAEVWTIGPADPQNRNRTAFNYRAIASLREGVTLSEATAELATLSARFSQAHPESNAGKTFQAVPLQDQLVAPVRSTLFFLFASAALLLLISTANVANLMLARATTRMREMAIRLSLGSNTGGVVRILLLEGFLLGLAASIAGLLIAWLALHFFLPFVPASIPHAAAALKLHPHVLIFAAAVSICAMLVSSLAPAWQLRRVDLAETLKQTSTRTSSRRATRSRHVMVVAQIAVCCLLSIGAVLLARSLLALVQTPLGFRSEGVLVMYADAPAFELPQYLEAIRTFETALDEIRRVPGVTSAAAVMGLPMGAYGSNGNYLVEGVHVQPNQDIFKMNWPRDTPEATFALASPQYFSTAGIHLLAGRDFANTDRYDAPFAAIVSQSLARQSFGNANPIGRRIYCGLDSNKPMTIVGVVSDVRQNSPSGKPEPEIYMPFQQHPYYANELQIAIRTAADPTRLAPDVRRTIERLHPYMAIRFTTFREMVDDSIAAPRFRAALIIFFAVLAVLLAMAGIYASMSYWVSDRTAELGLRMALGAHGGGIIALVSRQALGLAALGTAIGAIAAVCFSNMAKSFVFGVQTLDAWSYVTGLAIVLTVVMCAALLPALRAARIDPAVALRDN